MGEWVFLFFPKSQTLNFRQERTYGTQKETINNIKEKIKQHRQEYNQQKLINIKSRLTSQQCRLNDINTEEGASAWLSTLPIEEEGYISIISDMGCHYPEHQEREHVGTTLTSNILLHAQKEGLLHTVTTG